MLQTLKKKGEELYRVYFNPEKYSFDEELATASLIPEGASITYRIQQKFRVTSYIRLSKASR